MGSLQGLAVFSKFHGAKRKETRQQIACEIEIKERVCRLREIEDACSNLPIRLLNGFALSKRGRLLEALFTMLAAMFRQLCSTNRFGIVDAKATSQ